MYVLAFQDQYTFPKRNIFCYCSLFICIGLSRPVHPPKVKYSLLLYLVHIEFPFSTTTPSQSEIFSVIVTFSYAVAFQDQTPSQSEIFFQICYCYCRLLSLFVCMYWPSSTSTPCQSEIFSVIVTCSYVLAFQDQTSFQSEIFSVIVDCSYVLAF